MINFIVWIIAGALIGWIASRIMKTSSRQGLIADIVIGIVGAFVGGLLLSPLVNAGTINEGDFSLPALLVSLVGAVILLAIFKMLRKIVWVLVIVLILLIIYLYVTCWPTGSISELCTNVRSFLP